jgi:hypothetical protein
MVLPCEQSEDIAMKLLCVTAASLTGLLIVTAPSLAAPTHPLRPGEVAADPQTTASLTQGPDMITRAGSSPRAARADLDSNHVALAGTMTAKRWHEIRDRDR